MHSMEDSSTLAGTGKKNSPRQGESTLSQKNRSAGDNASAKEAAEKTGKEETGGWGDQSSMVRRSLYFTVKKSSSTPDTRKKRFLGPKGGGRGKLVELRELI